MSRDEIYFSGEKFISLKRGGEISNYTKDYIGQLCRAGKLKSRQVGRDWFVCLDDLILYKNRNSRNSQNLQNEETEFSKTLNKISSTQDNLFFNMIRGIFRRRDVWDKELFGEPAKFNFGKYKKILVPAASFIAVVLLIVGAYTYAAPIKDLTRQFVKESAEFISISATEIAIVKSRAFDIFGDVRYRVSNNLSNNLERIVFSVASVELPELPELPKITFPEIKIPKINPPEINLAGLYKSYSFLGEISENIKHRVFDIFAKLSGILSGITKEFAKKFSQEPKVVLEKDNKGMLVIPSTGDRETDEEKKQRIKDSFSDEVVVMPDSTGSSGIIKPIFRDFEGDNYLYVLVPIKGQ